MTSIFAPCRKASAAVRPLPAIGADRGGGIVLSWSNVARAPPRPLNGITLGDRTFMRIQRTLSILWLVPFIGAPCFWLWQFLNKSAPAYDGIHALHSLVCLLGIVASIFLFQGARWARFALALLALYFAVGVFVWEILAQGWMRVDKLADDALFVFSLVTVALLIFPRREPVA